MFSELGAKKIVRYWYDTIAINNTYGTEMFSEVGTKKKVRDWNDTIAIDNIIVEE